ncbi:TIGR03619 family F420-dependent LLM class oxidoreductase [Saccharothrix hoggarensis]|uniref:TIGR03619 family F420-dependent LLM class oxidoreductase n=1 Tax=Saccharothrix hoggarensis TaxID=913853 RepID=A0ABW3QMY9_9PSEU
MHLGVSLEPLGAGATGERFLDVAATAERLGFNSVLMSSHLLAGSAGSAMDPVVLLSAVAGHTTRVRLVTSVLVLPYYHPVVLANQLSSLDVLSGGRFVLGVGVGWHAEEFAAVGVPVERRGARTDEHLSVLTALWSGRPVTRTGTFGSLTGARIGVTPTTPGGPPLWIGGHTDAALRRAARFGAGWHGSGVTPDTMPEIRRRLAAEAQAHGRTLADLDLSTVSFLVPPGFEGEPPGPALGGPRPSVASVVDDLGRLGEAGITLCALWMPVPADRMADAMAWVADEVRPQLG